MLLAILRKYRLRKVLKMIPFKLTILTLIKKNDHLKGLYINPII